MTELAQLRARCDQLERQLLEYEGKLSTAVGQWSGKLVDATVALIAELRAERGMGCIQRALESQRPPAACLDPEKMHGYADQFGGDEYAPIDREEVP